MLQSILNVMRLIVDSQYDLDDSDVCKCLD
jgi:hypothetical protein